MTGKILVLTGNGKGKTTSALGHAVQHVSQGKTVFIGQFLKSGNYSEIKALQIFEDLIRIEHYGLGRFVRGRPTSEDVDAGVRGYDTVVRVIENGEYDLVILDEGIVAVRYNIFSEQKLLDLFKRKPAHVNLIVTGRGASPAVMEQASLVIEMKEIKHYYQKGVCARVGIEK